MTHFRHATIDHYLPAGIRGVILGMGKDSTLHVSRAVALATIEKYLHRASNEVLEDMLYPLVGDKHCYNFTVNTYGEDDVTVGSLSLPDECRASGAGTACPTCHRED